MTGNPPIALSIAGSDSSAGAGFQADLKTFEASGVFGVTIATVLTAQNTRGVFALHPVPEAFISAQFDALFSDLDIGAIKTGLLTSNAMIDCVSYNLRTHAPGCPLVVDPVISASSGMTFMDEDALAAFNTSLAPMATLLTPNLAEAALLLGCQPAPDSEAMRVQAKELGEKFVGCAILLKGGHLEGADEAIDILYDGTEYRAFSAPFIETSNTHGTGCTLSAAITAGLAKGLPLPDAITEAKNFVSIALRQASKWKIGSGPGPLKHRRS